MPTPEYHVNAAHTVGIGEPPTGCPAALTPPAEAVVQQMSAGLTDWPVLVSSSDRANGNSVQGNTAADMAQQQEDSMYITPEASPEPSPSDSMSYDKEPLDAAKVLQIHTTDGLELARLDAHAQSVSPVSSSPLSQSQLSEPALSGSSPDLREGQSPLVPASSATTTVVNRAGTRLPSENSRLKRVRRKQAEIAKVDRELDWSSRTPHWDFTRKRLEPRYPSSLFQCDSKYRGTQQSDRQTYNVDVRILTVDMDQRSCTGYLTIRELTPEHDTIQTYFTGEIIGGPDQKYSFRTKNAGWGASEKTDLTHWARFPAWRSLLSHAKRDLDFVYPPNQSNWWQQDNIFMRWKEHFLVPDHKTKSIAGASFEGFYYICLNQVEGRISGIYFHSKSEKYQQLELKHEGTQGIWHRGVTPSIEFR